MNISTKPAQGIKVIQLLRTTMSFGLAKIILQDTVKGKIALLKKRREDTIQEGTERDYERKKR